MKIGYVTNEWGTDITQIEVVRETEKCAFYIPKGSKSERKKLKDQDYHETWEAAKAYLSKMARARIEFLEYQVKEAKQRLAKIEAMLPTTHKEDQP